MLLDTLLSQMRDIVTAQRWDYPDAPAPAHIPDLASRITRDELRELQATPAGELLLGIIESYEAALNDDWLPYELLGLPLPQARQLLRNLGSHIREHHELVPVERVRAMHAALRDGVA